VTSGLIIAHFSDAKIITCSPASTFISKTTMKTFTLKKNLLELTFANEQLDVVSFRVLPGANPTIVSCNASAVKIYNATSSLVHSEFFFIYFGKRSSLLKRCGVHRIGSSIQSTEFSHGTHLIIQLHNIGTNDYLLM
jgi:hypothetical protein